MKFIPLTKKEPPFDKRVVITDESGSWCVARLVEITTNQNGKEFTFRGDVEGTTTTIATHWMEIVTPNEKE